MADEIEDYVTGLPEPARSRVAELYSQARAIVPDATVGVSYAMPALLYKGKGLLAVMNTKHHIGIYPFGNLAELGEVATVAGLETTKGSIHLRDGQSLPAGLLEQLLVRQVNRLDRTS
jgi:uncharacterized protein YdhG (YjbR/CyaY superfamily)